MADNLCVIVPVLDRPQNVKPLIQSFKDSGTPGSLWFIATATDTAELDELKAQKANYLTTYMVTWPQKINWAVNVLSADWYLFGADDITFDRGWWEVTALLRSDDKIGVIGTNDMANPRVMAGEHSTHSLVRAAYIDEHGTVDADEAVCSWYHHWFVDDELLWTAQHRGAWAHCADAVVRHRHPYFDTSVEMDETYKRGEANKEADQALFASRAHLFGVQVQ